MTSPASPRAMRLALIASALLVLLGLFAFWYASNRAKAPGASGDHAVTVSIKGKVCDPNDITVPAGKTIFTIVNATDRALEWEILDGVMVVDERENIAPGLQQVMTVKLAPGDYEITCGLLNNPRGKLHVTPSVESDAEAARPSLVAYVGLLAEYQVTLLTEAETLDGAAQQLVAAIKAGQRESARAFYPAAHASYVRIEAAAQLFGDLDARLNARADYYEKKDADPGFMGFRRIERSLAAGGDMRSLAPVGDRLLADIATLKERLATLELRPEQLADLSAKQVRRLSESLAAAGNDSPADVQAVHEATTKVADLLSPLLAKANPALDKAIRADLAALDCSLARTSANAVFDAAQRKAAAGALSRLADDLGKVNAALGLA